MNSFNLERLTWAQTRARIRADHARLVALLAAQQPDAPRSAYCHPSFVCVLLHRISNHLYRAHHRWFARIVWHLNVLLTGAEIAESCDLGEGLVIVTPPGVAIMGTAGRNLTVMACAGLGGEMGRHEDIGAGQGLPVVGDDVILEPHSGILGPVRIGHRVRVGLGCGVTKDVPDDAIVEGPRCRTLRRRDLP